jgi:hypothetical protein
MLKKTIAGENEAADRCITSHCNNALSPEKTTLDSRSPPHT